METGSRRELLDIIYSPELVDAVSEFKHILWDPDRKPKTILELLHHEMQQAS